LWNCFISFFFKKTYNLFKYWWNLCR
jgi:hypothetical protein